MHILVDSRSGFSFKMFLSRGAYSLSRSLTMDLTMPLTTGVIAVGMPLGMTGKMTHTDLEISISAGMIRHIVFSC